MTAQRPRAAVLGSPIAHTLSPALHRAAYAALGLDWAYDVIECDERSLPAVLDALARGGRHAGLSLTMPLKHAALRLASARDAAAERVGAANTLVAGDDRGWTAYNTDVAGVRLALAELGITHLGQPGDAPPAVLGAGGAARAVLAALADLGCPALVVAARDSSRAAPLVALGDAVGVDVRPVPWPSTYDEIGPAPLVVATTPAGATDQLARTGWSARTALFDVVYAPWPTALAEAAAAAGARVVGGLPMLVGQAAEAVTLMTGRPAPIDAMRAAGEAALAQRLVLPRHAE